MNRLTRNKTIKEIPRIERPREKLERYGPERLSNSELLAIMLRSGRKGQNVLELANNILKHFTSQKLPQTKYEDFKNYPGLGPAKACEIVACFELGKRLLKDKKAVLCLSPVEIWKELRDIRDNKKEHFVVFYLDIRNQMIQREIISVGSLTASLVHPREVFEPAIRNSASQIIVAHNHPSGNPEPSETDLEVTNQLISAGVILGIDLLDHVIVTKNNYLSLSEQGRVDFGKKIEHNKIIQT